MIVFKTISEEHVGEISLFKVLSGSIKAGWIVIILLLNKSFNSVP